MPCCVLSFDCRRKRHGGYHNDHCRHAYGGSHRCRCLLERADTLMTYAENVTLIILVGAVVASVWLGLLGREF